MLWHFCLRMFRVTKKRRRLKSAGGIHFRRGLKLVMAVAKQQNSRGWYFLPLQAEKNARILFNAVRRINSNLFSYHQHIFYIYPISLFRLLYKNMGYGTDKASILQYRCTAHALHNTASLFNKLVICYSYNHSL